MQYRSRTAYRFAPRVLPVAAMLALVFVVCILLDVTGAQAPSSPSAGAAGLLTATATSQGCAPIWQTIQVPDAV